MSLTNTAASVTGDGTVYTVLFDTTNIDHMSMYAAGTGKITIPSTRPGLYQVNAAVLLNSLTASYTSAQLDVVQKNAAGSVISDHAVIFNPGAIRNGSNQAPAAASALLNCSASDTIYVTISVSGSTKSVGVVGAATEYTYLEALFIN